MFQVYVKEPKKLINNIDPKDKKTEKYKLIKKFIDQGFCIFSFPRIDTAIVDGVEKKKPRFNVQWHGINKENHLQNINFNDTGFAFVAGKLSGVTVIDFNERSEYNRFIKNHPEMKKYRTVKTNKGAHIYCKYEPNIQTRTDALVDYRKVDIRNNLSLAFCPPCEYYFGGKKVKYTDLGGRINAFPKFLDLKQFHEPQTNEFQIYLK